MFNAMKDIIVGILLSILFLSIVIVLSYGTTELLDILFNFNFKHYTGIFGYFVFALIYTPFIYYLFFSNTLESIFSKYE